MDPVIGVSQLEWLMFWRMYGIDDFRDFTPQRVISFYRFSWQ